MSSGSFEVLTLGLTLGNGSGTNFGASQCIPEWDLAAAADSCRLMLGVFIHVTYSLILASGVTPVYLLVASMVPEPFCFTRHWWGSEPRPIMLQKNALLTELCWLGLIQFEIGSLIEL